jgi:hypothetical protein
MTYMVEVAHIVNGEPVSLRRLSKNRERTGALIAVLLVGVGGALAATAAFAVARVLGRAVFAPQFFGLWVVIGTAVAITAYARVAGRLGRYRVGTRLDVDAFAPCDVDLVRRAGNSFDLKVVPGMRGRLDGGRAPMPLEALAAAGSRTVPIEPDTTAEVHLGSETWMVRSCPATDAGIRDVPRDFWKLFSRVAVVGLELGLAATMFSLIPRAETIDNRRRMLSVPTVTTPWEAEKRLRIEAQLQAASLHQCFDPLPLSCQHAGYVGVGVSLNREGELRSNWIARSTYDSDCPVARCMKEVVSTWTFDPLPEAMRVILPVQVLRTEKPIPPKVAQAGFSAGDGYGTEGARGR